METGQKTAEDVMQVELDGTHRVTPLVQTTFSERNGVVSPDGRWLAYEADSASQAAASRGIIVVQHWREELKRLVPTK